MRALALYDMLFGLVILTVGLIGYFDTGDSALLLVSIVSGIMMISVGLRTQKGWRPGLMIGLALSLGVIGFYGYNYMQEGGAFVPYGLLPIMGIVAVLLTLLVLVQPKERTRDF